MEFRLPENIIRLYWYVFPVFMIVMSIYSIFYDWEFQKSSFTELEDFGRLLFVLIETFLQSALMTIFVCWILTKIFKLND